MEREPSTEKKKKPWLIPAVVAAALAAAVGAAAALYVVIDRIFTEGGASRGYLSSNYLTDDGTAEYAMADWGNEGVRFQLYNYEWDNADLISEKAIPYRIEAQDCEITVTDEIGNIVEVADGMYTMPGDARRAVQNVRLVPTKGQSEVAVRVTAADSRAAELSAVFWLRKMEEPDYTVTDQREHVLVTIHANDYTGAIKIDWSQEFSPDPSDNRMAGWSDSGAPYSFDVTENQSYELIFLKKTMEAYEKPLEKSKHIMIGEKEPK